MVGSGLNRWGAWGRCGSCGRLTCCASDHLRLAGAAPPFNALPDGSLLVLGGLGLLGLGGSPNFDSGNGGGGGRRPAAGSHRACPPALWVGRPLIPALSMFLCWYWGFPSHWAEGL